MVLMVMMIMMLADHVFDVYHNHPPGPNMASTSSTTTTPSSDDEDQEKILKAQQVFKTACEKFPNITPITTEVRN